jgi:uncharacterized protein involved in exopolysaccharide biosynthesis
MRDVLAALFRQRRLALACFAVVIVLTALYWLITPAYRAEMKVLVRHERMDPVVTAEGNAPLRLARTEVSEEELNSEVELLQDESLLRRVVQANGLERSGVLGWLGLAPNDDAHRVARGVRALGRRLKVDAVHKTDLITVSDDEGDPELAAAVLTTLADVYEQKHSVVHRPGGQHPFFAKETVASRDRLATAEMHLSEFLQNESVASAALERDNALQRASDLESNYRQTRVAKAEVEKRMQALGETMDTFPERSTTTIRTADNPQLLEVLKARLLELQLKRTELLKLYEPTYRLVREVDEQIAQAQEAIARELESPVREETTEKDPNFEWAKAELEKARVEENGLRARENRTMWELAQSWDRARQLGELAIQQQDLQRDVKTAEDAYLLYARKSEEARISDRMDERGILNVTIVEPPHAPVLPRHAAWVVALVGIAVGGTVSVGAALPQMHWIRRCGLQQRCKPTCRFQYWRRCREMQHEFSSGTVAMSAGLGVWERTAGELDEKSEVQCAQETAKDEKQEPDPVLGLVQQVFVARHPQAARQVVFAGVSEDEGVEELCERVARTLAEQTTNRVACVSGEANEVLGEVEGGSIGGGRTPEFAAPMRGSSRQIGRNLWLVTESIWKPQAQSCFAVPWMRRQLGELRHEFEFAVIHGPPIALRSEAALLGRLTDGLVLVVEAHRTRRLPALRVQEELQRAQVQVLGAVLRNRTFPIPEKLYRRI